MTFLTELQRTQMLTNGVARARGEASIRSPLSSSTPWTPVPSGCW